MPEASHGFDITRFRDQIAKSGTLQTNKFIVELTLPAITGGNLANRSAEGRDLSFRIEKIKLPGLTLNNVDNARYGIGPTQKFPMGIGFTETSMTIIDDRSMDYWLMFSNWIQKIYDYTGPIHGASNPTYGLEYKVNYITDIKISIFNNEGTNFSVLPNANAKPDALKNGTIILKNAYPTALNDMPLDWAQTNNLFKPVVNFTFQDWYFEGYRQAAIL